MQCISDCPDQSDARQLPPERLPKRSELFKLALTRDDKHEACDKQETRRDEAIDVVQDSEPPCFFERRNDKRIEDVNLDHHDGCPAPQQIDEDQSAFHSWLFSRTER